MGSGALRGDEFNSIAEASPTLLRYMAEGLGVNVGKLRELGSEGKLTAEALSNAFEKVKSRIDSDFAQMPVTVGKAFTDLRTEISLIVGDINEATGATQTISGAITGFANALKENKDTIVGVVSGIGTLIKHLGILGGTYLAIKGSMAAYAAMTTTVTAQTAAGVIQLGFMDRALMKIGVTAGSLKAVFMGFLPTLAIFAAVEAFFALKDSMDKAKPSADKLNDALSKTNEELQKLTQNQRDAINLDLKASLDANFRKIDEINRKLEEHNKFGGIVGAYRLEADEIVKLKAERDDYIAQNSKIIGQRKEIANINSEIGAVETQQQKDAAYINSLDKKVKDLHVTTLSNLKKEASKLKKEIDEILSKPSDNIRV
jgi:phage tape measure protein